MCAGGDVGFSEEDGAEVEQPSGCFLKLFVLQESLWIIQVRSLCVWVSVV